MQHSNFKRASWMRWLATFGCVLVALLSGAASRASTLAPTISGTPAATIAAGSYYAFTPKATAPKGYSLTYSIVGKPAWAGFNRVSGQILGTPTAANVGLYGNIKITVSDGAGSASIGPFSITVTGPSKNAPTISGAPATTIAAGSYYAFTPKATAPKGYSLTYSIVGKPAWAGFNKVSGQLLGTPTAANVGKYGNIKITASDGAGSASIGPFSITVTAVGTAKPVISGTPATTATVGTAYSFTPKASDPAGGSLSFSVQNKPAWAAFSIASGTISGTPTAANVGTYSNIVISVSDGQNSASLAPFSITVKQPAGSGSTGTATLTWTAPVTNTNGSALTDLAGYKIHYGKSASSMTTIITVANPASATYTIGNLASGTWYFAVSAYTTSGVESALSSVGSKSIP